MPFPSRGTHREQLNLPSRATHPPISRQLLAAAAPARDGAIHFPGDKLRLRKAYTPRSCVQTPPAPPQYPLGLPLHNWSPSRGPSLRQPPGLHLLPSSFPITFSSGKASSTAPPPAALRSPQVPTAGTDSSSLRLGSPSQTRRSPAVLREADSAARGIHLPYLHRGPAGGLLPRRVSCPFKEAAQPGCARSPWLPRCRRRAPKGGREAAAAPRQTEGAAGTRHPAEPVGSRTAAETGATVAAVVNARF